MKDTMNLKDLGYDDWFASHASEMLQPGQQMALVIAVDRGAFLLRNERGETTAQLSGRFRFEIASRPDVPCVGDWVCVEHTSPTLAIIHAILPRKSLLRRKCPGKTVDFQMIAANLEAVFIVQSCHYDFNIRRLERYLVATNEANIAPIVILSKTDLVSPAEVDKMITEIREAGILTPLLPISNTTGSGLEALGERLLPGKTFCLLGSSGVGKSTLINRLIGREVQETRTVSETGEGAHTTSRRQLLILNNGAMLIDTPGMRELGLLGASEAVEENFSDIHDLSGTCRFRNCTHVQEPGCAVRGAIETRVIDEDHYASYLKLKKETEHHDLSYAEKRKKDKNFGKLIKTVTKNQKKMK